MLIKLLLTAGVIYIVYVAFFKKPALQQNKANNKAKKEDESDEMIACDTCSTYTTRDDAIISLGKHYCSSECVSQS